VMILSLTPFFIANKERWQGEKGKNHWYWLGKLRPKKTEWDENENHYLLWWSNKKRYFFYPRWGPKGSPVQVLYQPSQKCDRKFHRSTKPNHCLRRVGKFPQKILQMQRLLATKIQRPEAVERDPSFSFLYENNIHHFDLILLPGLTLHTETNDVTANLKKKEKTSALRPLGLLFTLIWNISSFFPYRFLFFIFFPVVV